MNFELNHAAIPHPDLYHFQKVDGIHNGSIKLHGR